MKALIQLGRFGDVMNMLPLLEENNRLGRRAAICVSSDFASVLDGVSYCEKLIFGPQHWLPAEAMTWVRAQGHAPVVAQLYGNVPKHERITESFMRDQWVKVGRENRWEQLSLVFDRRSPEREQALAARFDWSKPVVLYNTDGVSSPFENKDAIERVIDLCPDFSFIDLSSFRAERIYDLLGLFDRAHALMTVDTATLHLAKASTVPVVAFVNPQPWYGSLRAPNHLLRRAYNAIDPDEVSDALAKTLLRSSSIVHVWPDWEMSPDDRRRNEHSRASWCIEYRNGPWKEKPVRYSKDCERNSKTALGDTREVPFVADVIRAGLKMTKRDSDIVVITNSDVGFTPGLTDRLNMLVSAKGAAFAYRFNQPTCPSGFASAARGSWDGGLDLFAFTRGWLKQHLDRMPDMVMGCTHWDLVYRDRIKQTGGGDLTGAIWHEPHKSFWTQNRENVGNTHNIDLARAFFKTVDTTRPYRD